MSITPTPPIGAAVVHQIPAFMDEALAGVIEEYARQGVDLPVRRYWTIGDPAADCEQAVLAVQQAFLGVPNSPMDLSRCDGPRSLTFTLQVLRCVPVAGPRGSAPAPEAIQSASVPPVVDMEIMLDLAAVFDKYGVGIMVTVDVVPANGGFHGAVATYTVNL